ncbi:CsbD family protein [Mycobacterium sp. NPDC050853]|uniref:microaggregate-binding protein 1 n=1 Tax=Mycobacteriaceae TaxID=1762 RepID=UPI0015DD9620|nr:CsbD family protein [Mycobacteroides sp. LB1]
MSDDNRDSGIEAGIKGVVEDVKGKAKEAFGKLTDDESLEREGQAQQDKAEAQREVAAKEAAAEKARAEAAVHQAREDAEK